LEITTTLNASTGSGGGNDVGSIVATIIIMRQDKRRIIPKVDSYTTPVTSLVLAPGMRIASRTGHYRVVTNLAVMGFHPKVTVMAACHPRIQREQWWRHGFERSFRKRLRSINSLGKEDAFC
jgi:acyl CoA:acetate/3-ketoacid CoA transferase beta subunit